MKKNLFYMGKKFQHYKMAEYLKSKFKTIILDEKLYFFEGKIYKSNDYLLKRKMTELEITIKESQRQEVLHTLKYISPNEEHSSANFIAVRNGVIDINTNQLYLHSPDYIITSLINVDYNENAYNPFVDDLFNTISNENEEVIKLLKEIVGYTLYRSNFLGKAFLLKGEGGNGKSTFLRAITGLLGKDNITSLSISELGSKFNTGLLNGKLANIGDDVPYTEIKDTSVFKKLTTGETLKGENKNQSPFFFENYSKLIFSANRIPKIRDQSQGFKDRFVIVPFTKRIRDSLKEDHFFNNKITSQSAKEYLLMLGIHHLSLLLKKEKFTLPQIVKEEIEDFDLNNNIVRLWLEYFIEEGGDEQELIIGDAYLSYVSFIKWNGIKNQISKKAFTKELEMLGYQSTKKYVRTGEVRTQKRIMKK
ncbi:MAG TPA: phage/plasmid primase, P4 family [Virgibacillus sp.]|nr:phage/plasmid primase, P4 family [Virgibacillus sp.]HLR66904.1 phage/plasmid primase, P4 family [Virgibacillus sp.]